MSKPLRLTLLLAASLVLVAIDQLAKLWAFEALKAGNGIALWGPVDLRLVLNRSNAFGIAPDAGEATRWLLVMLSLAVVSALTYFVATRERTWTVLSGSAFIIAGGIGNAIDRIRLGAVVDMFDASEIGFVWVFNTADVFIDIGIGLWLVDMFLRKAGRKSDGAASSGLQR